MSPPLRAGAGFRKRGIVSRLSDLIWPPRSLLSEAFVDRPGVIEAELWGELKFLGDPQCSRCGFPLPDDPGANGVSAACAGGEPAYDAALAYDDHARRLILDLKRGGRRDGLAVFARWMSAAPRGGIGGSRFPCARAHALDAARGAQLQSGGVADSGALRRQR